VQRNVVRAPISAGTLKLADGCFSEIRILDASSLLTPFFSRIMSICFWISGVKTNLGQIAFTVTPIFAF